MNVTTQTIALTHGAALKMLEAATAEADRIGQPQCIVMVDASGVEIGVPRMTGAKFPSLKSARSKARTAASTGSDSATIPDAIKPLIALATALPIT